MKWIYTALSIFFLHLAFLPTAVQAQCYQNGILCEQIAMQGDLVSLRSQLSVAPQFVSNGDFIPQNTLRANFPCSVSSLGKYARVSDMYQTVASVAICETDGATYYWRPQRTDFATTSAQSSGTVSLVPFVTSPVVIMTAAPTGNITITPSNINAWPGAQFRVIMPASINLPFGISIGGLVGGNVISALQGRDYVLTYTAAGWKSN